MSSAANCSARTEPIAIIGSSCRFPGGVTSTSQLWNLLTNPVDLSREVPPSRFNVKSFYHADGERRSTTNAPKGYWLEQDHRAFDASFFNITPKEAEAIDPQHKILLETVYEGMETAGLTIQECWGKDVSVHVGIMTADYEGLSQKDEQATSQYTATGTSRALISNRVSYFFNWHGPSMTIDTACSSSLVALHQAVQGLRSGESSIACVAGANLMLGPEMFIVESSLHMLSPTGKSRMWDKDADGYARGEGFAVVFLKRLSQALADGGLIEGIIRETGVNSDGRTKGITMPNPVSQASLIRETYKRASLDPHNALDRCQYFEAHGTGTQAGDPREAEAIYRAFFGDRDHETSETQQEHSKLLVGSIKTVIGHTEGAAGLAGVLKVMLAMKHNVIPPNQHLHTVNPTVEPFLGRLEIPTTLKAWPETPPGQPLRASVNSFGFGGTNGHAIIERYDEMIHTGSVLAQTTHQLVHIDNPQLEERERSFTIPFLFSAHTDKALTHLVESYAKFLRTMPAVNLSDLAWTLSSCRSILPHKIAFSALDQPSLVQAMEVRAEAVNQGSLKQMGNRTKPVDHPRILGIFTGQGAQWPTMGKGLIEASPHFSATISKLENVLQQCPDPPSWSLKQELLAMPSKSRLHEASISQPLCTAVQIALVDLLKELGITLSVVVGHSSGEIAAAYSTGMLSAEGAILIAYYRGVYANFAMSPNGVNGGMLAVGVGKAEAEELCNSEKFKGRLFVAACNAPTSVTLSGDIDAIHEAKGYLDAEKKFARILKVNIAYHSPHMESCAKPYLQSLSSYDNIVGGPGGSTIWISSVTAAVATSHSIGLTGGYWKDNMVKPVLFSEALQHAVKEFGPFDAIIEVGPHPALKGPAIECMQDVIKGDTPYFGVLDRSKNDFLAFSNTLGLLWSILGPSAVDFNRFTKALGGTQTPNLLLKDLPLYPWDHSQTYYRESRLQRQYLQRQAPPHELLGVRVSDDSDTEMRWRNILRPSSIPWAKGHRFQGQILLPASAYCVMALDASRVLAGDRPVRVIELEDLIIKNAITLEEESQGVELLFSISVESEGSFLTAKYTLSSTVADGKRPLRSVLSGKSRIHFGNLAADALPCRSANRVETRGVNFDDFYTSMQDIGLDYTGPFRALAGVKRRMNFASGILEKPHPEDTCQLPVRPALLDACFQTTFAAFAAPGDGALWTSFLPQRFRRIRFNLSICDVTPATTAVLEVDAYITQFSPTTTLAQATISCDIEIFNASGEMEIQVEDLTVVSFAAFTEADDRELFLQTIWKPDLASGILLPDVKLPDTENVQLGTKEIAQYSQQEKNGIISPSPFQTSSEVLSSCEKALPCLVPGLSETSAIATEHARLKNNITYAMELLCHRYPRMNVLNVDFTDGQLVDNVLQGLGNTFLTYTYAHPTAKPVPSSLSERLHKEPRKFAAEKLDPSNEGTAYAFQKLYDLAIYCESLDMLDTNCSNEFDLDLLTHALKPGGYLIHITSTPQSLKQQSSSCVQDMPHPSPSVIPLGQTRILRSAELAGPLLEFDSSETGYSMSVFQYTTKDYAKLLRPLDHVSAIDCPGDVLIIGGNHPETKLLVTRLQEVLIDWKGSVRACATFEDIDKGSITNIRAAIIVADLDEPIIASMNQKRLSTLQNLFSPNRFVLWLTGGFLECEPYHYASVGFGRCIKAETPQLDLQFLDLDNISGNEDRVAEAFLRLAVANSNDLSNSLWTLEPELIVKHGETLIPRVKPVLELNNRLNSSRRVVAKEINTSNDTFRITSNDNSLTTAYRLHTTPMFEIRQLQDDEFISVNLLYTSVWAVKVQLDTYLFIGIGHTQNGELVLVATPTHTSRISVPRIWTHPITETLESSAAFLDKIIRVLVSQQLMNVVQTKTLVIHEADHDFATTLEATVQLAHQNKGRVLFSTYDRQKATEDSRFIQIHPNATGRSLRSSFAEDDWTLINVSSEAAPHSVQSAGPSSMSSADVEQLLFRPTSKVGEQLSNSDIGTQLNSAWLRAKEIFPSPNVEDHINARVSPAELILQGRQPYFMVLNWTNTVGLREIISSVNPKTVFSAKGTYLLVGLTGELGQSLCTFMVRSGARNIVVTSRNPQLNPVWREELERLGAKIAVVAMDVTKMEDVRRLKADLSESFPPVTGVMNAAMVLSDGIFSEMTVERFERVLKPKVDGSRNLDEVFSDPSMEFFVLFSSFAAAGGNKGQCNYAAANMFMAGLAGQRRKRGLAASVLDIGMLAGVGYVNRPEGPQVFKYLRKQGYPPVCEQEMHQMILETILAGRIGSSTSFQLTTGIHRYNLSGKHPLHWHNNPRFSHHTVEDSIEFSTQESGAAQSIRDRVYGSSSQEAIREILEQSFAAQLEQMLQLPVDSIDVDLPIIDLGIDSLVAVEVRTWFMKEVGKDMPVLKVLGGSSISILCAELAEEIFGDQMSPSTSDLPSDSSSVDGTASRDLDFNHSNTTTSLATPQTELDDDILGTAMMERALIGAGNKGQPTPTVAVEIEEREHSLAQTIKVWE